MDIQDKLKEAEDRLKNISTSNVNIPASQRPKILCKIDEELSKLTDIEKEELIKIESYLKSYKALQDGTILYLIDKHINEFVNTDVGLELANNLHKSILDSKTVIKEEQSAKLQEIEDFRVWSMKNPKGTYQDFLNYKS